ncbi:MAG: ABC transporter permease [Methanomassiliicoccaceae archaeon]|jgi:ABC-2 type transport system permease protein|nr:ABC transporter permease [Methanomassiliicoccaceae archaeon]
MNHLWNLIRKELKELLTPASVISIIVVALLFASLGGALSSEVEKAEALPVIGVVSYGTADHYRTALDAIDAYYSSSPGSVMTMTSDHDDAESIINEMKGSGISVALVFGASYSDDIDSFVSTGTGPGGVIEIYWCEVSTGVFGAISAAIVSDLIDTINHVTAAEIVGTIGGTAAMLTPVSSPKSHTSFNGKMYDGYTPSDISGALQSQSLLMPILMMIIITMIGSMIISSMGNEKENKTLETLLTMPVKRTTIVSGKLIGAAIAGLIFGVVYMAGMYVYTNSMSAGSLSLNELGLTLGPADWIIVAAVIFLAILSALGICMILGAFVKNYKAAQTLTLPISVLAMIPMFVTMFVDFNTLPAVLQAVLFAIPFTHPMMIMNNLMLGDMFMVWAGLGYLAVFALVMIYITVRIYNSDILLTGLIRKRGKGTLSAIFRGSLLKTR